MAHNTNKWLFIFCLFWLLPYTASSQDNRLKNITVNSIYDGDTFKITIPNTPAILGDKIAIRVRGIDAPEMRSKAQDEREKARLSKQFTVAFLRSAKHIELRNMKRGKYFRIIADVFADGKSLAEQLLLHKLAAPY